jgi:DNA primase
MDLQQNEIFSIVKRHLPGPFRPSGGTNILTKCPFHKGGEERKPSFSIDVSKGVYHCFTCHEAGSVSWLLRQLGLSREQADAETAPIKSLLERNKELRKLEKEHAFGYRDPFATTSELPEAVLGIYDLEPPLPLQFDRKVMREMEVGFDQKLERVTYPLRDMYGKLAGISGGATRKDQMPKYDVYQGGRRDLNGRWIPGHFGRWFDEEYPGYTCENHDFLWNFHRIWQQLLSMSDPSATLIIVEGFKACLWMLQHGYWATVALMGSYISDRQQKMIHRFGGTILLMLDNDETGRRSTGKVGDLLWEPCRGKIRVANYPLTDDVSQPDDYYAEALNHIVRTNIPFEQFIQQQVARGEI